MLLKSIELQNFRNYQDLHLKLGGSRQFVTGANGAGKTNLLEAIFYLSQTRSFKKAEDGELIRRGSQKAVLRAGFTDGYEEKTISAVIEPKGRTFAIDGAKMRSATEVIGNLLSTSYDPSLVFLFKDEPSGRRRFLDETLSPIDPQYLRSLSRYKKYLKERNQALVLGYDPEIVGVLTGELIHSSYRLHLLRARLIDRLDKEVAEIFQKLDASVRDVHLAYRTNTSAGKGYDEYLKEMREEYEKHKSEEVTRKMTLIGIHRDDVIATLDGLDLGASGSQGQNRLVTLAMKLAVANLTGSITGKNPILLLDDVASDLDPGHLERLLSLLADYPGQILVTGCQLVPKLEGWEELHVENDSIDRRTL